MKTLARIRSWLKAMTHRSRVDREMQSELEFHIASYAADLMRIGLSQDEARRRAQLELGTIPAQQEKMRESLGLRLWDDLQADLRYGWRMLRRSPGFTAIAIASLALGIGANTIIFTLAMQALIDTLPVPHAEQLRLLTIETAREHSPIHSIWGDFNPGANGTTQTTSLSYPVYQILRAQNHSLQDLFAFKYLGGYNRLTATIDGHAQAVEAELISGNYYQELEAGTQLGRSIGPPDDARPGDGAVATISDGFWSRAFGRSPAVIGRTIQLNLTPITIIGVNQPEFTGAVSPQSSPDVFVPLSMQPVLLPKGKGSLLASNDLWWLQIMGRKKPGVSDTAATAALAVSLDQAIRATLPVEKGAVMPRLRLSPGSRGMNHSARELGTQIYVLLALVGLVLLLACANIANLLLARSAARQREISVRIALGASRRRILRQVFTETLLLSALGGAAGLLVGYLGRNALPRLMSDPWAQPVLTVHFDWRAFAFTAAISLVTGLFFGLAPALHSTRGDVNAGLKGGAATATRRREGLAGKSIVVFQVSLSTLLLVGAGLFARTLFNLNQVDIGFRPQNILLFHLQAPHRRYPYPKDLALYRRIEEKLAVVPDVDAATLSAAPLLAHDMSDEDFIPDSDSNVDKKQQVSDVNFVGQDFFPTMGIRIVAGRGFSIHDTGSSQKVAVINQAIARKFYPSISPIGKSFHNHDLHIEIVGIAADAKYDDLRAEDPPTYYAPYLQAPPEEMDGGPTYELHLKTTPDAVLPSIRAAVASIDQDLPLLDVRTQSQQIDAMLSQERLFTVLTSAFGVLALTLSCIGIYGVLAYNVARRTNEIGIRMALGARAGQVLAMVLREASWLAAMGVAAGLCGALAATRFLSSLLYGLQPRDPETMIAAAGLLLTAAIAAAWAPAWRASRVQPMEALRHE